MVHKKYTYKDGKRFGPYLYENKRVNGKVVTTYLGSAEESHLGKKSLYLAGIIVGIFAVLLLLFFVFQNGFFSGLTGTGKASLDIKSSYKAGEKLDGKLEFNLKAGELVPKDSKVRINLGGEEKEIFLNELVSDNAVYGNYFAEGADISGAGEGYGISGEKINYPEVSFSLEIFEKGTEEGGIGAGGIGEENASLENESIVNETAVGNETLTNDTIANESISNETAAGNESVGDNKAEKKEEKAEEKENKTEEKKADENTGNEEKNENKVEVGITGEAVSENSHIINGKASKNNSFSYPIDKKEDVKIVSNSVKANAGTIEDNAVSLKIADELIEVSTDYFIIERGFGEGYFGKKGLSLEIDLGKFEFSVNESGKLSVELAYGDIIIVKAEEEINLEGRGNEVEINESEVIINETETNITEMNITKINVTEINVTEMNITEINITTVNETIVNLTSANISVNTIQYSAVLGKPVRWKKTIVADKGVNFSVEIPAIAENVSVIKVVKADDGEEVAEEVIIGISGNVINGQISADLDLKKEPKLIKWIKNLFGRITGLAVFDEENVTFIEINESREVEIEYYTEAPSAVEEELNNGKEVRISGPEEVHYENVLVFTELDEKFNVKGPSEIKIYWRENNTYVPVERALDNNGDGLLDYVEWIVPHLSNQTFDIILITKAEHLDENRTFISDIYDSVKELDANWSEAIGEGEYVRVTFERELDNTRDITIYPRIVSGEPKIEVYEIDENETIAEFSSLNSDEYNKVYLTNLSGKQDSFDLRIIGGSIEIEHIIDPTIEELMDMNKTGIVVYGEGTVTTPRARNWNGTAFSAEDNLPDLGAGVVIEWVRLESNPKRNETMLGIMDDAGNISLFIKNNTNSTWTSPLLVATLGTTNDAFRGYDIAYEDNSGNGIVVYENNGTNNALLNYRIWDGSSWSEEKRYSYGSGAIAQTQLIIAIEPQTGSNNLLVASKGANDDLTVTFWNGTAFLNSTWITPDTSLPSEEMFATAWESNSGLGVLVYGTANATTPISLFQFNTSTGSWTEPFYNATVAAAAPETIDLCSDPNSDYIGIIASDSGDITAFMWDGTEFHPGAPTGNIGSEDPPTMNNACEWGYNNNISFFGFSTTSNSAELGYLIYDRNTDIWSCPLNGQTVTSLNLAMGSGGPCTNATLYADDIEVLKFRREPIGNKIMVTAVIISSAAIDVEMALFNGTDLYQFTNAELETDVSSSTMESADFTWNVFDYLSAPVTGDVVDNEYPTFSNAWDNNGTLNGTGIAFFNTTIKNTNGSAFLQINGTNFTASNWTATLFNISIVMTNGTYEYQWISWGNGTSHNINKSVIGYYTVNTTITTNIAPNNPILTINSTDGTNKTAQDLNCFTNISDPDGDRTNVTVVWYNNSILHLRADYNNSYTNNSFFTARLDNGNTTKRENWSCGMRLYDGTDYSDWVNSSMNVTIVNTAPSTPTLSLPADGSTTTNRAPNFTWSASTDADSDSLTYELNVSLIAASTCSEAARHVKVINGSSYQISGDLKCLYDNLDYYNWSARAYDGTDYSNWGKAFILNISSLITISLPNNSVQFSDINFQGTNDTSNNAPLPFLIQNDGNAFVNITIQATSLWNTVLNPTAYYQFKIDNYTLENYSFIWGKSVTTYTNIPFTGSPLMSIAELNYTNATDTAEIDVNITVPFDEGSGVRSSTITFTSSLAE